MHRMRTKLGISLLVLLSFAIFSFQNGGSTTTRIPNCKIYYGCQVENNNYITVDKFLNLMNSPICAKDSIGNTYRLESFEIVYAETGLYQDSTGLPITVTDYSFASFTGDKIDAIWQKVFTERLYNGDSIKLQSVRIRINDSMVIRGPNTTLIIQ